MPTPTTRRAVAGKSVPGANGGPVASTLVRHRWSDEQQPPTLDDARKAAQALAEAGAARVLLYGSLARGEQRNGSDIDLVAIYDDADSSKASAQSLGDTAREAAGCDAEVEVFVADRAEWAHRTRNVRSSFEAHIARSATVLYDRPAAAGTAQRDKEAGRPADDLAEARSCLDEAMFHLGRMEPHLAAITHEAEADGARGEDAGSESSYRLYRIVEICHGASMAARWAIGAVVALEGRYARRDLDVAQLGDTLAANHRKAAEAARAIDAAEVEKWQGICPSCLHDIYPDQELSLDEQAAKARRLAGPATDLLDAAAEAVGTGGAEARRSSRARERCDRIRNRLRGHGAATGQRLPRRRRARR